MEIDQIKEKIRTYLKMKRLTVNMVSKRTGTVQTTLNNQINGDVQLTVKTLLCVIDCCDDLSLDWLLRDKGEMIANPVRHSGSSVQITKYGGNGKGQIIAGGDMVNTADSAQLIRVLQDMVDKLAKQNDMLLEKLLKNG